MTFCSHCGAQLQGDERFCVACGTPVSAAAGPAVAAAGGGVAAAPVPSMPAAPVPAAPMPMTFAGPYPAPGQYPLLVGGAPPAAAKSGGSKWTWIVIAAVVFGGYFYSKEATTTTPPATAPVQPGGTAPQGTPGSPTQPGAPAPGTPAQPVTSGPVVEAQVFSGHWQAIYGKVELTNTSWTNKATAAMQSASLECDQYAANGSDITQSQMTLNGPVQPGGTVTFNPFQMGSVSPSMSKVNCWIVAVTPAN